jgi:hypothetical protein
LNIGAADPLKPWSAARRISLDEAAARSNKKAGPCDSFSHGPA